MIRECHEDDVALVYEIINEATQVYKGIIPQDHWKEPHMPESERQHEINEGVAFWGYEEIGQLVELLGL